LYRFQRNLKSHWNTIGPCDVISFAGAQILARDLRVDLLWRTDTLPPTTVARIHRQVTLFEQCANEYMIGHLASWTNKDHAQQWPASLQRYVPERIALKPAGEIGTEDVLEILTPLWTRIPTTAMRLRGRLEAILDYAIAKKYRSADNPARWKGLLENLLPAPRKLHTVRHHPALSYDQIPQLMAELGKCDGVVTYALAFTIFTCCRTKEVRNADWSEIDTANKIWTIPAERMKTRVAHRVPLTNAMLAILRTPILGIPSAGPIFIGLSRDAMQDRLQRMRPGFHVHGFRSSFRDWAAGCTNYPEAVPEMCLAHSIGNAVKRAYFRTDLFAQRRALMEDWSNFCLTPPAANVVPLRA
jgi:integrase